MCYETEPECEKARRARDIIKRKIRASSADLTQATVDETAEKILIELKKLEQEFPK